MMKHVLQNFDWECATPGPVIYATPNQQMLKKFYLASSFLSRQSEARCFPDSLSSVFLTKRNCQ